MQHDIKGSLDDLNLSSRSFEVISELTMACCISFDSLGQDNHMGTLGFVLGTTVPELKGNFEIDLNFTYFDPLLRQWSANNVEN